MNMGHMLVNPLVGMNCIPIAVFIVNESTERQENKQMPIGSFQDLKNL